MKSIFSRKEPGDVWRNWRRNSEQSIWRRNRKIRYTAIPMTSSLFIKINMRFLSDTVIINMFPRINGISSTLWRNSRLFSGLPVWKKLLRGCPDMMRARWIPPEQSCRLKWSVKDLRSLTGTGLLLRPETIWLRFWPLRDLRIRKPIWSSPIWILRRPGNMICISETSLWILSTSILRPTGNTWTKTENP